MMEKRRRLSVCFILTFLSTACGDVVYLHAQRNSSIEFSCMAPAEPGKLFAFSLCREWLQNEKVLYHNFLSEPSVLVDTFKDRITDRPIVSGSVQIINVSITLLQGHDTDLYTCLFHYDTPTGFKNQSGKNKFLLYVKDYHIEPRSCYIYTPLLFSLSAAAALLFLIILILTAVHCMKLNRGGQKKPQLSAPIYEDMKGVQEKANSCAQEEEVVSSLYLRPKKENPYVN